MDFLSLLGFAAFIIIPLAFSLGMDLAKRVILSFCPQPPVAETTVASGNGNTFAKRDKPSTVVQAENRNPAVRQSAPGTPDVAMEEPPAMPEPPLASMDLEQFDYTEYSPQPAATVA